jgi:multiple sugar transport system substrate-binding protein
VGDTQLGETVSRLESEWRSQAGYGLEVEQADAGKFLEQASSDQCPWDAVVLPYEVFPSAAASLALEPIPRSILEDEQGRWTRVFGTLRVRVLRWAEKPVAVPLGMPIFVLYLRSDKLESVGAKPPATWAEYQQLAERLARLGNSASSQASPQAAGEGSFRWFGTLEPLGPGWRGLVFLARAATYVSHRDNYSTYFAIESMEPLIDREPFVRALEELVAAARLGPSEILEYGPAEVRAAFWKGQSAMAITWPTAADSLPPPEKLLPVSFAELPGSADVYDLRKEVWERRRKDEPMQIPLLGVDGRVGIVPKKSGRAADAFQFLFWLSVEQAGEIAARSPFCSLYRSDHLTEAHRWVESAIPQASAIEYALLVRQTLEKPAGLLALPLPGRKEYLRVLDDAVASAVRGELSPREALRKAAQEWDQITERLGRQAQRDAFRKALGVP